MRFCFQTAFSSPASILFKGPHLKLVFPPLQVQGSSPQPSQGRQEHTEEPAPLALRYINTAFHCFPLGSWFAGLERKLNSHRRELDQKWSPYVCQTNKKRGGQEIIWVLFAFDMGFVVMIQGFHFFWVPNTDEKEGTRSVCFLALWKLELLPRIYFRRSLILC